MKILRKILSALFILVSAAFIGIGLVIGTVGLWIRREQEVRFGQHHFQALGRKPKGLGADRMNRTETEYAGMLDLQQRAGGIVWWRFEAIKIRLADNTFYTPDFLVLLSDMRLECHEVKGSFVTDDAKVKLKVAAETCPFGVVLAQKVKKAWHVEILS